MNGVTAPERVVRVARLAAAAEGGDDRDALGRVRRARALGFDRLWVDVRTTSDGWNVVHPSETVRFEGEPRPFDDLSLGEVKHSEEKPATLEETLLASYREGLGLLIALHDRRGCGSLDGALGILTGGSRTGGDGTAELRRRFLVVVATRDVGERLRRDAPVLPSCYRLRATGGGWRAALARRMPNVARAAAQCDDLLVSATTFTPSELGRGPVPKLRRRGAYVWVEQIEDGDDGAQNEYGAAGVAGVIVDAG